MILIKNGDIIVKDATSDAVLRCVESLTVGEFSILARGDEFYIQVLIEGGDSGVIEYREGCESKHYQARFSSISTVSHAFNRYLERDELFGEEFNWFKLELGINRKSKKEVYVLDKKDEKYCGNYDLDSKAALVLERDEKAYIKKHGKWLEALSSGGISPETSAQSRFVKEVSDFTLECTSSKSQMWRKYRAALLLAALSCGVELRSGKRNVVVMPPEVHDFLESWEVEIVISYGQIFEAIMRGEVGLSANREQVSFRAVINSGNLKDCSSMFAYAYLRYLKRREAVELLRDIGES